MKHVSPNSEKQHRLSEKEEWKLIGAVNSINLINIASDFYKLRIRIAEENAGVVTITAF